MNFLRQASLCYEMDRNNMKAVVH